VANRLGPDGALEALIEAREQGLVRHIGVTGHGLSVAAMHRRALDVFDFDSVLCPYNYVTMQNPKYTEDFETLYRSCRERNVAIQTIKSTARRLWGLQEERTTSTWYNPLTEQSDIDLAVHWVLGREGIFLNTASDITLLPKILDAASRFTRSPGEETMQANVKEKELSPLFY
jgi:predicted aldo/keto reductase-like oxidoreductase